MRNLSYRLINIYYFIGILIIFLFSNFSRTGSIFYKYWLLSVVPLSLFLLIKKKFIIKGKLDHILIYLYSVFSIILNIISNNLSLIPYNIITNLIYSKDFSDVNNKIYKITRLISCLGIILYFLKAISIGRYFALSPFLFSKNMVILPFLPYMILYHCSNRRNWDSLLYYLILIIFVLSSSISNLLLSLLLFISLLLPNYSFKNFCRLTLKNFLRIKRKILILNLKRFFYIVVILIPAIYLFNNMYDNFSSKEIQKVLNIFQLFNIFGLSILSNENLINYIPRISYYYQYIESLSFIQYFIGNPKIIFYNQLIDNTILNPHNSIILAHMNMGIFGILVYLQLILRTIHIFINKNIKFSILAFALLIRSISDSILVLTGLSSFLLFWILFGNLNQTDKISNKKEEFIIYK